MPARRSPARIALLAVLALSGCAYAVTGFQPVAGGDVVDESYGVLRRAWNSGDVFHYAFALRPVQGRAALCGAVGREPSGGLRGVLDGPAMRGIRVTRGEATVMDGIDFFAGPYEGADLRGRPSNCVATDLPWTPDMADPSSLRLSGSVIIGL